MDCFYTQQCNKWKVFHHITLYGWTEFPPIAVFSLKNGKTSDQRPLITFPLDLFHLLRSCLIVYGKSKENKRESKPNPGLKLMDPVREVLRYHHCAYRTEQTYCQ